MSGADRLRWRVRAALFVLAVTTSSGLRAADVEQQSAWGAWFNTLRLGGDWSLVSDVQLRSADDAERLRNGLLRGGISHSLTPSWNLAAGYARISTHEPALPTQVEHRTWQQMLVQHRLGAGQLAHRLRLEQRSIDTVSGDDIESDRLRYFLRWQSPLQSQIGGSPRGTYLALQNETFFNLSANQRLNGQRFDQNRAYLAWGLRLNPTLDLEVGYLNQAIRGRSSDIQNHVLQVAILSRF